MSSPSNTKQIWSGSCACDLSSADAASSATTPDPTVAPDAFRPDMTSLHSLLQHRQWGAIQDAIRKDASVSMRISDSEEEDRWFDEARRRKAMLEGVNISLAKTTGASSLDAKESDDSQEPRGSHLDHGEDNSQMQLRYWVGNQSDHFVSTENDARVRVDIQQKRTLLHSLCRMYFSSDEALVAQLTNGDSDGLNNLMGAVKTAQMLIAASHNCSAIVCNGINSSDDPEGVEMDEEITNDCSSHCNRCPCYFFHHYCPPVPMPPVERPQPQTEPPSTSSEDESEMILHTSALTMTDAMGNSPLHTLTGAGSCHVDLIKIFLNSCRPLDGSISDSDRRPCLYDLLILQNFAGCTPLHFLADRQNEEVLCLLLEQCQPSERIHPTMICDNDGDLPLHFAACNGASPSLLLILTDALGDARSVTTPNYQGRLAIDDFIEWYMGEQDVSEIDDASETESENDSDSSVDSSSNSEESGEFVSNTSVSRDFKFLSSATNWESELWPSAWVLIQSAAKRITNLVCHDRQVSGNVILPVHAAVIACRFFNFPALALVASILRNGDDTNDEDYSCISQRLTRLLEKDFHGCLPLHWACGGVITSFLLSHSTSEGANVDMSDEAMVLQSSHNNSIPSGSNETNPGPLNPSTSQCKEFARWNTNNLPSMIEYLLHCEPIAARIPTRHGRLPLHLLAEDTKSFNQEAHRLQSNEKASSNNEFIRQPWDDIVAILKANPDALGKPDAISRLYPFQLAGVSAHPSSSDPMRTCTEPQSGLLCLENIYRLIMEDPSILVNQIIIMYP